MTPKFSMIHNRVALKRHKSPETIGRIFVPKTSREPLLFGEVVAAGPGRQDPCKLCKRKGCDDCGGLGWKRNPITDLAVGDVVVFQLYSEEAIPLPDPENPDGDEFLMVFDWSCVAKVNASKTTKTTLTPREDRIVVKRDAPAAMAGSLLIPDEYREARQREEGAWGTVLSVGPDVEDSSIRPTARVLLPKHGGTTVKVDGEELVIHSVGEGGDVLAVIDGEERA
jgi:co-chaperonin GroES (HSP10)